MTDGLLAQLREHEGEEVLFASHVNAILARTVGASDGTGVVSDVVHLGTVTGRLLSEADGLEAEAANLETRAVPRAGGATGADVAEVFAAVLADPFRIGPTLEEVTAWAASAEAEARAAWQIERLSNHLPVDDAAWREARPLYALAWRPEGIAASSRVTVPAVPTGHPADPGRAVRMDPL